MLSTPCVVRLEQILSRTESSSCWVYPRLTRSESSESRHLGEKREGGGEERGNMREERREKMREERREEMREERREEI